MNDREILESQVGTLQMAHFRESDDESYRCGKCMYYTRDVRNNLKCMRYQQIVEVDKVCDYFQGQLM